jgi:tetratricopeptide (TPR) repeat protein
MGDTLEVIGLLEESNDTQALERTASSSLPAEVTASFHAGLECLNRGEPGEAARCFEALLARAPDFADGHVGLGIAYAVEAKVYPALDHLERATRLEPGNFYAHFKLGQLYFKLRVPKKGYFEAERALRCATTLEEKRLVAQIVKEERQREHSGLARPTWDRPFSRHWVRAGLALLVAACVFLAFHLG